MVSAPDLRCRINADLLAAVIGISGMSVRQFAAQVMARDERTVRRWLAGDPMPEVVAVWLSRVESIKPAKYRTGKLVITLLPPEE